MNEKNPLKIEFELEQTDNPKDLIFNALIALLSRYKQQQDYEFKTFSFLENSDSILDNAKVLIDLLKIDGGEKYDENKKSKNTATL